MYNMEKDNATYPELGHIYSGDYCKEIPFGEYITKQDIPQGDTVFDIRVFGAIADSDYLSTEAFHRAAEACKEAGGGTIVVAGGTYRMGTVYVPNHTTLFINSDAEIIASRNVDLLLFEGKPGYEHGQESGKGAFVVVENAESVRITGGGKISGDGEWFVYEPKEKPALKPFEVTKLPRRDQAEEINNIQGTVRYYYRQRIRYSEDKYKEGKANLRRPSYMVWVNNSRNVQIDNIILHDAMCWTLNLECSDHIKVYNLIIDDNRHVANSDGIDITGSSDVQISHCFVSCADDGIVIKNPDHTRRAMHNICIRDCTVTTVMSGFKIGTETGHDIADVLVENCRFYMPDIYPGSVSGISIESCDGSHVSDVTIRNIMMDKVLSPIYICLNMRNRYNDPYIDGNGKNRYWGGSISNILIENVRAENAELPCIMTGFEAKRKDGSIVRNPLKNIQILNFVMKYRDNSEEIFIPKVFDEFLRDYPESNAHGDVDACGIWVRHADGIILENISILPRHQNTREKIKKYDVKEI